MRLLRRPYLLGAVAAGCGVAAASMLRRSRPPFNWRGKVVLITGGSRGLGLGLARALAQGGARVAICGRDETELLAAEAELRKYTSDVLSFPCDVSDAARVELFTGAALDRFGRIDMLINNAGVIQVGPFHTMTIDDYEEAMRVMFWAPVYTSMAVLPHMLKRGEGRIVNVTSIGGKVSVPHLLPYSCAKFAAVAFSEGLRSELRGTGVTVTTIAPGLMRTGSFLNARFKGDNRNEAAWFSISSSAPAVSMSARRAVDQILAAAGRGQAEKILSVPAQLLALFHGIFPGLTTEVLGIVNGMLPQGQGAASRLMEPQIRNSKLLNSLTVLGRRAAEVYLQDFKNHQFV